LRFEILIMSSPIFYIPPEEISGDIAVLSGEELRHARTTLRLGPGDQVNIIDGVGGSFEARLRTVGKDQAALDILARTVQPEPVLVLTIAMGIVKGERYEWALQKATELGASAFIPLVTERTEVKVKLPWKRLDRLQRIVISACKQCGRARFPILHEPIHLEDLELGAFDLSVAFWEGSWTRPLTEVRKDVPPRGRCLMIVGPVGGFSSDEAKLLKNGGCFLASLGPRILRTETAVAAGATLLQYLYGDMG
jgi:16S rRNA (uracil1498-N3)-methyltransferase